MIWTAVVNASGFVQRWVSGPADNVPMLEGEFGHEHEGEPLRGRSRLVDGEIVAAPIVDSLAQLVAQAQVDVDVAAGRVRLRYITDVPGQQATYARKEQQARDWLAAGFAGPAPSFIAAEASAIGVQPQLLAQQVLELAEFWAEVKGPEIEAARIKHKAAVRAATTESELRAAVELALVELEAM